MSKLGKISGFPEWLPEQKIAEDKIITAIRTVYESFGFTPIETPAVELVSTLSSKGVVAKEIYALRRLQDEGEESELALHFDLTVPFARYVAQHTHNLIFPFKRYQLQKVWRGDRPQKGRFREFYQFDIDIIARDTLPVSCDAEVMTAFDRAFLKIGIGKHTLRINNRKILKGFYESLGLSEEQSKAAITVVDKLDKIGVDGIQKELTKISGISSGAIGKICEATTVRCSPSEMRDKLSALAGKNLMFTDGVDELTELLSLLPKETKDRITVDMSLARGLDYYTGMIVEVGMVDHPEFGTVGSGGRYENLASDFSGEKLPGVGVSIGLTRLLDLAFSKGLLPTDKKTPAELLITVYSEAQRLWCNQVADELRAMNIPTEVFYRSPKLGKQIEYAEAKGIKKVLFLNDETKTIEVKDLTTKEQRQVKDLKELATPLKAN